MVSQRNATGLKRHYSLRPHGLNNAGPPAAWQGKGGVHPDGPQIGTDRHKDEGVRFEVGSAGVGGGYWPKGNWSITVRPHIHCD